MRSAAVPLPAPFPRRTCTICSWRTRCWAPSCSTTVNLAYYQSVMADIRTAIRGGRFDLLRSQVVQVWRRTRRLRERGAGHNQCGRAGALIVNNRQIYNDFSTSSRAGIMTVAPLIVAQAIFVGARHASPRFRHALLPIRATHASVAPTKEACGPPKDKPGAVTAPGFGIVRKDAFSYSNPVSLSRDFSDFRTLDAGLAQGQDGARQRTATKGIGLISGRAHGLPKDARTIAERSKMSIANLAWYFLRDRHARTRSASTSCLLVQRRGWPGPARP